MTSPLPRPARAPNTPPASFGEDAVAWAMWLYYAEGRTQNEVAQTLGVSRASVANYLSEARRRGLVSINMQPDVLAGVELGRRLSERYGLAGAHVVPAGEAEDEDAAELRRRLGAAGGHVLRPRLRADTVLGVAWGRTMLALAQALPEQNLPELRVVQVSGSSLGGDEYSPEFCTGLIATRLGARCENFHAPAIVSSREMRDALLAEPGIARQLSRIKTCDIVVFGVGELDVAVVFSDPDFLTKATVAQYLAKEAVGVMIGRFIDAQGEEIEGPLSGRQIGIELDALRAAPERICVAGGPRKLGAIRAILAAGYATHLVTDAGTARRLVED